MNSKKLAAAGVDSGVAFRRALNIIKVVAGEVDSLMRQSVKDRVTDIKIRIRFRDPRRRRVADYRPEIVLNIPGGVKDCQGLKTVILPEVEERFVVSHSVPK